MSDKGKEAKVVEQEQNKRMTRAKEKFIENNIDIMESLHKISQPNNTVKLERQYADEAKVIEEEEEET